MDKKVFLKLIICVFFILFVFTFVLSYQNKKIENISLKFERYTKGERILFLGDSITSRYDLNKYYTSHNTFNSGVGGNQTTDILNDLDNRVYKYNPTMVFLLIGTNDLVYSGLDNSSIKINIEEIVTKIHERFPDARIYLESIYPVDSNVNKEIVESRTNDNIKLLNSKIKNICDDGKCTYINMFDILKNKDGNMNRLYTVDGLHLSKFGYKVVTKELLKYIEEE